MRRNYKFRIYPTEAQKTILLRWEGVLRLLWNLANMQRCIGWARCGEERVYPSYFSQGREMTMLLDEYPFIEEVPSSARQETLSDLHKGWQAFFNALKRKKDRKKAGGQKDPNEPEVEHPRFRHRDKRMRIYLSSSVRFTLTPDQREGALIFHGKRMEPLGAFRIVIDDERPRNPRKMAVSDIKSWSLLRDAVGDWYAVACTDVEAAMPVPVIPVNDKAIALRRGGWWTETKSLEAFLTDSQGDVIPPVRAKQELERREAHARRVLERRQKDSKNREKARVRLAKIMRLGARRREALIGYVSRYYAERYGTVVVDKLDLRDMTESEERQRKRKKKKPKDVPEGVPKSEANKKILDNGWGNFLLALRYKIEERGGRLVEVSLADGKQQCPSCGHVSPDNLKTGQEDGLDFRCVACGHVSTVGHAHARNILARGLELLAEAPQEAKKKMRVAPTRGKRKPKPDNQAAE